MPRLQEGPTMAARDLMDTPEPTPPTEARSSLTALLKIARAARNTYVGRHWPDKGAMRRDGIGFGLNDGEHEDRIRRFLYECQPEFLVQYLEQARTALAAPAAPALDVERLREALALVTAAYHMRAGHGSTWDTKCPGGTCSRARDLGVTRAALAALDGGGE